MFVFKALPQATVTFVLLVQAFSVQCHYYSSTTEYPIDCEDGELTEAAGMFTSPGYPGYGRLADCSWHITVKSGSRVELNVLIDEIEPDDDCTFDAILVYDGGDENAALLAKECGEDKNLTFQSTGNEMVVVFRTDDIDHFTGFTASYVTISPGIVDIYQESSSLLDVVRDVWNTHYRKLLTQSTEHEISISFEPLQLRTEMDWDTFVQG